MVNARVERRLAAILAADSVGYSRLIETDEAGTLGSIRTVRSEAIDPLLAEHKGRIVKLLGDGAMVELARYRRLRGCTAESGSGPPEDTTPERRIVFRIGINLGDVVVEGDDLLGEGVNVAARLEAPAEPGGIYIADAVKRQLAGKNQLSIRRCRRAQVQEHRGARARLALGGRRRPRLQPARRCPCRKDPRSPCCPSTNVG